MADNEAEDAESEASVNHRQLNETTSIEDVDYSDGGNPAVRLKLDVTLAIRHECERLIDDYNSSNRTETEGQIFCFVIFKMRFTIEQQSIYTALHCPPIFDGWACWNATPAGSNAYSPCPFFITGFDPSRNFRKIDLYF